MNHPIGTVHRDALAKDGYKPDGTGVVNLRAKAAVTKYHAVELVTDGDGEAEIQHPGTLGNRCIGVALADGAIGEEVPVLTQVGALVRVKSAGGFTNGDLLAAATTGKVDTAVAGGIPVAQALETAVGGDEDILAILHGLAGTEIPE